MCGGSMGMEVGAVEEMGAVKEGELEAVKAVEGKGKWGVVVEGEMEVWWRAAVCGWGRRTCSRQRFCLLFCWPCCEAPRDWSCRRSILRRSRRLVPCSLTTAWLRGGGSAVRGCSTVRGCSVEGEVAR